MYATSGTTKGKYLWSPARATLYARHHCHRQTIRDAAKNLQKEKLKAHQAAKEAKRQNALMAVAAAAPAGLNLSPARGGAKAKK